MYVFHGNYTLTVLYGQGVLVFQISLSTPLRGENKDGFVLVEEIMHGIYKLQVTSVMRQVLCYGCLKYQWAVVDRGYKQKGQRRQRVPKNNEMHRNNWLTNIYDHLLQIFFDYYWVHILLIAKGQLKRSIYLYI